MEHTELPECEHSVCDGMASPEIRHKLKLVIIKMKSHSVITAGHSLIFPSPSGFQFLLHNAVHTISELCSDLLYYYLPNSL
jgi:hypothetical protein